MQKQHATLNDHLEKLKKTVKKYQTTKTMRRPRKVKELDQNICDRTKRRRLNDYKCIILKTLKDIKFCHRAEISLWLSTNRVHFSFSPKDFKPNIETFSNKTESEDFNACIIKDHMYAKKQEASEIEDEHEDVNYSDIYDCVGNWQKKHIRRIDNL